MFSFFDWPRYFRARKPRVEMTFPLTKSAELAISKNPPFDKRPRSTGRMQVKIRSRFGYIYAADLNYSPSIFGDSFKVDEKGITKYNGEGSSKISAHTLNDPEEIRVLEENVVRILQKNRKNLESLKDFF